MTLPEVWLRGPLPGIPALLQPVAHVLLQAVEEVQAATAVLRDEQLWQRPAGLASPGFHLKHMSGVIDRMCTYARGLSLSEAQFAALKAEGEEDGATVTSLVQKFRETVDATLEQLAATDEKTLADYRAVGRKALPSTVIGLLVHAAEHTQRHLGQLLVTVRVITAGT
ncbi:MAG TPA: DinB family protein [Flavisolibacter sp.]|nr:DinB family protein [Flavisolibacter sp.]